jgi:hypothetical protein
LHLKVWFIPNVAKSAHKGTLVYAHVANRTHGNGSDLGDFTLGQGRQALLGPNVIGVVPVVNRHHAVLQLPNAVDDLIEELAVVKHNNKQAHIVHERHLLGRLAFNAQLFG